jgi:hypothetical protein
MIFVFETEDGTSENFINNEVVPYEVTQIPLKTWFHIALTSYDNMVEIYMDGALVETIYFENAIKINYSPLHIAELGGFDGYISKLAIFSGVLSRGDIQKKYLVGPGNVDMESCVKPINTGEDSTQEVSGDNDGNTNNWSDVPLILTNDPSVSDVQVMESVVTVYSRPNFKGSSVDLPVGIYSKWDLAKFGISPGTISGIKMLNSGYITTLYKNDEPSHTDGQSDYVVIRNDSDWDGALKPMNNKTHSIKIEPEPYPDSLKASFYQRPNYKGWGVTLPIGKFTQIDLLVHGFQIDELTSHQIQDGFQARLYSEDFFGGEMAVMRGNDTNMTKLNNKVRSLKLEPYSDVDKPLCKIFKDTHYRGDYVSLSYGDYQMYDLIKKGLVYSDIDGSFKMRSVMIPDGFNMLIYPQDSYSGVPQRLEGNEKNIQEKLFHMSIINSIQVVKIDTPKFSLDNLCTIL